MSSCCMSQSAVLFRRLPLHCTLRNQYHTETSHAYRSTASSITQRPPQGLGGMIFKGFCNCFWSSETGASWLNFASQSQRRKQDSSQLQQQESEYWWVFAECRCELA
ncbi:hypothetical protein AOLI_G00227930 [Acnodon oligacanthus]